MLARLSSIPHAISESISKAFNCRRKSNDQNDEDPISVHKFPLKPFKLQSVPSLVFEHVLHQVNPIELIQLLNCSEKTRISIQRARLASHCDLEWADCASEISITMKSGCKWRWCFESKSDRCFSWMQKYPHYSQYKKVGSILIGKKVKLQIYINSDGNTIHSMVHPCADSLDYFFDRILSIFRCPIRTLTIRYIHKNSRFRNLFKNESIKKCENLNVLCLKPNDFQSLLRDIEVTKRVTISYIYLDPQFGEPGIELENLVNVSSLSLEVVNLRREQLLSLNNEHLDFKYETICEQDMKAFLMRWMDGEHERLKTLRCIFSSSRPFNPEPFLDGLKVEQLDPSDTRPCLVKFSDKMYIDCTTNMESDRYRTVRIRNREGQNGTIVLTGGTLHFVVWSHPVPPVEVPEGHVQRLSFDYPCLIFMRPRITKFFSAREKDKAMLPGHHVCSFRALYHFMKV